MCYLKQYTLDLTKKSGSHSNDRQKFKSTEELFNEDKPQFCVKIRDVKSPVFFFKTIKRL